ncbi:MAG: EutN/CcmL family microcompartment protein [Candidatus Riflebacteria bacterium]|nr:EutN/CcmL family microcompartment protein [Candidatus Riflebacteria bacterium]
MLLGRVVGDVVATFKDSSYAGKKILWVQPLDLAGRPKGDAMITLDVVGAGSGEKVLVVQEGGSAQMVCGVKGPSPIGSAIVAIVDEVESP